MKLERVRVSDFRSFLTGAVDLTLADGLNVLIGPNNCGKGTLLHAVRFALAPEPLTSPVFHNHDETNPFITCELVPTGSSLSTKALAAVTRYLDDLGAAEDMPDRISVSVAAGGDGERTYGFGVGSPLEEDGDPELLHAAVDAVLDAVGLIWVPALASLPEVLSHCIRVVLADKSSGDLARTLERLGEIHEQYRRDLDACLFEPLETDLASVARDLFPEIDQVSFEANLDSLIGTIGSPWIDVRDANGSSLVETGSGLRAVVAVAIAEHLLERSERSFVCLFEEPEAFLHPGAQEQLSARLERLAMSPGVSVLATSESPFLLPRSPEGQVVSLKRVPRKGTVITGSAPGDQFMMRSSSELFSDSALAGIFDRAARIPDDAAGIVVVEGWTDEQYLRIAARKLDLASQLETLAIVPAEGATKAAMEAVVIRAETDRPLVAIFDDDESGRSARGMLRSRFNFKGESAAVLYNELCSTAGEGAEAEDIFAPELIEQFVQEFGEEEVVAGKAKREDRWQYDLDQEIKGALPGWIESHAAAEHLEGWREVLEKLFELVGSGEAHSRP